MEVGQRFARRQAAHSYGCGRMVGRTPWSAAGPLAGLSSRSKIVATAANADEGVGRGRQGPPHAEATGARISGFEDVAGEPIRPATVVATARGFRLSGGLTILGSMLAGTRAVLRFTCSRARGCPGCPACAPVACGRNLSSTTGIPFSRDSTRGEYGTDDRNC
jgi:hypothetical protein